ncbi:hypothetical protein VTK73DRAFT_9411 [Phialemonium thermophilum]|uniref:Uncharacterized protein n=1 Tax=Phialemonium thermophilum TaxID=223376 RepID=A0ABR3W2K0_9PEZI
MSYADPPTLRFQVNKQRVPTCVEAASTEGHMESRGEGYAEPGFVRQKRIFQFFFPVLSCRSNPFASFPLALPCTPIARLPGSPRAWHVPHIFNRYQISGFLRRLRKQRHAVPQTQYEFKRGEGNQRHEDGRELRKATHTHTHTRTHTHAHRHLIIHTLRSQSRWVGCVFSQERWFLVARVVHSSHPVVGEVPRYLRRFNSFPCGSVVGEACRDWRMGELRSQILGIQPIQWTCRNRP